MLKRLQLIVMILLAVIVGAQPGMAQQQAILTDAQIESITQNCQLSKVSMNRVHTNDVVIRVNLGQRYETIARRLMAPLNSRIASNSLDNIELTKTTVAFNDAYIDFTDDYRSYDIAIQRALRTDCREEPIEYYRQIEEARAGREAVAKAVDRMQRLAKQYGDQVVVFGEELGTGATQ